MNLVIQKKAYKTLNLDMVFKVTPESLPHINAIT